MKRRYVWVCGLVVALATSLVTAWLGYARWFWPRYVDPRRVERPIAHELEKLGAWVHWESDHIVGVEVVRRKIGEGRMLSWSDADVQEAVTFLEKCPHLQYLALVQMPELTDAGLSHIGKLKQLTRLRVSAAARGKGLADWHGLRHLKLLSLTCPIDDAGVSYLPALPELEILDLTGTEVSDESLSKIVSYESLRALSLSATNITGSGIAVLRALPNLEELDIGGTAAITEDFMDEVARLSGLRRLYLAAGTKVTTARMKKIENALPGLKIEMSSMSDYLW